MTVRIENNRTTMDSAAAFLYDRELRGTMSYNAVKHAEKLLRGGLAKNRLNLTTLIKAQGPEFGHDRSLVATFRMPIPPGVKHLGIPPDEWGELSITEDWVWRNLKGVASWQEKNFVAIDWFAEPDEDHMTVEVHYR